MGKAIKAKYKDGVIIPLEKLDMPDGIEISIIINNLKSEKARNQDWQKLRGILKGTKALQDHEQEHREEIAREESL